MKYRDPFLGEIELEKIGEDHRYAMGVDVIDTIYIDKRGNYYIHTWNSEINTEIPIQVIRKSLIDKINELTNKSNRDTSNHNER